MRASYVTDALARLEGLAAAGGPPDGVAHEAEAIAAGWWCSAQGDLAPDRLVLLVQELQRWCHLNRAGRAQDAEDAARWAQALDQAQRVLRVYA